MRSKPPLVLVIGPSGAGKSTMIRGAMECQLGYGMKIAILPKDSTRESRSDQDDIEYRHISKGDFAANEEGGYYLERYTIFGESYGLRRADVLAPTSGALLVQTVPTDVAVNLKRQLSEVWSVSICLLDTPPALALERLLKRADRSTLLSLEARMVTASRDRRSVAHFVIDGGRPAEDELSDFMAWLSAYARAAARPSDPDS